MATVAEIGLSWALRSLIIESCLTAVGVSLHLGEPSRLLPRHSFGSGEIFLRVQIYFPLDMARLWSYIVCKCSQRTDILQCMWFVWCTPNGGLFADCHHQRVYKKPFASLTKGFLFAPWRCNVLWRKITLIKKGGGFRPCETLATGGATAPRQVLNPAREAIDSGKMRIEEYETSSDIFRKRFFVFREYSLVQHTNP